MLLETKINADAITKNKKKNKNNNNKKSENKQVKNLLKKHTRIKIKKKKTTSYKQIKNNKRQPFWLRLKALTGWFLYKICSQVWVTVHQETEAGQYRAN